MASNLLSPHVPRWKFYKICVLAAEIIATHTCAHAYVYTQASTHNIPYDFQKIIDLLKLIWNPSIIRLWLCTLQMEET